MKSLLSYSESKTEAWILSVLGSIPFKSVLQRLPGTWYILFVLLLVFGPAYSPIVFSLSYLCLHMLFLLNNIRTAYGVYRGYYDAKKHSCTTFTFACDPMDELLHVIILPNYKESMETLCETLDVLSSHSMALTHYKICLAMEAAEAESTMKAHNLIQKYQDLFYEITFTVHPQGVPGEVRGKSSNVCWAAKEMARTSNADHEIITVMDADTCFAQDYFTSVSYHYTRATAEERRLLMFAPYTVFDRNSDQIPSCVRIADMMWSAGVMSHLYPSSPIKFPCSAYSISMSLAQAVEFWDTDATSIGEDFHMYLKCFFSTQGQVKVVTIPSPASQCNIQGSSYVQCIVDRYNQSVRHMWGSLDTGYVVRRCIFALLAPGWDAPDGKLVKTPIVRSGNRYHQKQMSTFQIFSILHRCFEAHIIMGHIFPLLLVSACIIPVSSSLPFAPYVWSMLSNEAPHPFLVLAVGLGGWIRFLTTFFLIPTIYYYEKYLRWTGTERWIMSLQEQLYPGSNKVQPLGRRPQLIAKRTIFGLFDWLCIPISGFLFLAIPQFYAHTRQLFTDSLTYIVAAKPTIKNAEIPRSYSASSAVSSASDNEFMSDTTAVEMFEDEDYDFHPTLRKSRKSDERGDSGYFEFEERELPYTPGLWSLKFLRELKSS